VSCSNSKISRHAADDSSLELAKWLALVTMAVDHYGKIVEPSLYLETHAIGRLSFPLFATIIGVRMARRPDLASVYWKRLLPWAVVSQPVFVLAGRDWYDGNIMLTLLIGVLATDLIRQYNSNHSTYLIVCIAGLIPAACFVEFGILGAAMIPATAALATRHPQAGLWASGPLGLAAGLTPAWPPLQWVDSVALLSSFVAVGSTRLRLRLPRLPTHLFYGFYPAHILVLHFYDIYG